MEHTEETKKVTIHSARDYDTAHRAIDQAVQGSTIHITPPRATDEMTSRLHCAIRCVAKQVKWAGEKLNEEQWKLIFVAAVYGQKIVPSPKEGGGFVVFQMRTRDMTGPQKSDMVEFVYEFGSRNGVVFDDPQDR